MELNPVSALAWLVVLIVAVLFAYDWLREKAWIISAWFWIWRASRLIRKVGSDTDKKRLAVILRKAGREEPTE